LHRPFKVPLSTVGCLIMLLPALVLLFTILILPIVVRDWQVVLFTAGTLAVGSFLYPLLQLARKKQWFQFDDYSPEDFSEHLASTYAPVVNERDNEEGIAQHSIP
jgi:4-amino-4-deoxy-L-arabinose transferase-like glycosyltransferase